MQKFGANSFGFHPENGHSRFFDTFCFFPNWGTWAPGLAPAPALALALGGPGGPGGPWGGPEAQVGPGPGLALASGGYLSEDLGPHAVFFSWVRWAGGMGYPGWLSSSSSSRPRARARIHPRIHPRILYIRLESYIYKTRILYIILESYT